MSLPEPLLRSLFQVSNAVPRAAPPPVQDTRYVSLAELRAMMAPTSGLLWSPWFRCARRRVVGAERRRSGRGPRPGPRSGPASVRGSLRSRACASPTSTPLPSLPPPSLPALPRSIIAENFLEKWWADLDETLATDKHVDAATIHRIMA